MTAPKPQSTPYVVTERQSSIDWPSAVETGLVINESGAPLGIDWQAQIETGLIKREGMGA